jgi:cytochrome c oxidase subunit 4
MDAEVRLRLLTWAALIALLALTIAVTYAPIGSWRLALSLAIAAAKASLIYWVFMDLRKAGGLLRLAALAAGVLLALLIVLPTLDFAIRR